MPPFSLRCLKLSLFILTFTVEGTRIQEQKSSVKFCVHSSMLTPPYGELCVVDSIAVSLFLLFLPTSSWKASLHPAPLHTATDFLPKELFRNWFKILSYNLSSIYFLPWVGFLIWLVSLLCESGQSSCNIGDHLPFLGVPANLTPGSLLLSLNSVLFSRMFTGRWQERIGAAIVMPKNWSACYLDTLHTMWSALHIRKTSVFALWMI